jgi:hypothetical protein
MADWQHPDESSPFAQGVDWSARVITFAEEHILAIVLSTAFLCGVIATAGLVTETMSLGFSFKLAVLGLVFLVLALLISLPPFMERIWVKSTEQGPLQWLSALRDYAGLIVLSLLPDEEDDAESKYRFRLRLFIGGSAFLACTAAIAVSGKLNDGTLTFVQALYWTLGILGVVVIALVLWSIWKEHQTMNRSV